MKQLSASEKRTLTLAGIAVAAILVVAVLNRDAASTSAGSLVDSLGAALDRIDHHRRLVMSVEDKRLELGVEIPFVDFTEQEKRVNDDLLRKLSTYGLEWSQVGNDPPRSQGRGLEPIEFRITGVAGGIDDVLRFVDALETSAIPYVVTELRLNADNRTQNRGGGGGARGRGGRTPTQGSGRVQGTIRLNSYMFPDSALAERPVQIESPEPEPDRRGRNDRNEGRGRDSRDEEPPRREEPPPDSEEATEAALTEASLRVDPEALAAAASLRPPISNGGGTTGTVALSALFQDPTVLLGVVESVPEKYHDLLDPSLRRVLSRRGHSQAELESAVNELSAEVKAGAQDIGPMIEALRAIPLEEVDRHQHPDFYGNLVRLFRRIP